MFKTSFLGALDIMRRICRFTLILATLVFVFAFSAFAKDYTKEGTYVWKQANGLYYAYDAATRELIRNQKVGKCYVDDKGTRYLNCFVEGIYYNTNGFARRKFTGGWVKSGGHYYYFKNRKLLTGYRKINNKYYYLDKTGARLSGIYRVKGKYRFFKKNGVQITKNGWKTINGKRYYINKNGVIKEGFFTVNKKKYYQTVLTGIYTGQQEINGKLYYFSSKGVYSASMTQKLRGSGKTGKSSDILFFTKFESGSVGYAQTGGDSGKACGKYQFDYRYSLVPFLNYCYKANKTFFKGFKPFLNISPGSSSLINNKKLYEAWAEVYKADSKYFSTMQDNFALEHYYKPVEDALAAKGINLAVRAYVCRGAVFSYSIQHGQTVAVNAVIKAGLTDAVSDRDFLKKLYDYRWKDSKGWAKRSVFNYRYTQEKALALSTYDGI